MMYHLFPADAPYTGTVATTEWLTEDEQRAWRALQSMQLRLTAALSRQLVAESELSYQDYVVLVALTDRPDGRMRLFELARDLGWEKSRLSHHIARMTDRKLVAKEVCTTDRRGAHVVASPRGREAIRRAAPGHVAAVRRLFVDRLTDGQLEAIAESCEAVLAGLVGVADAEVARSAVD